MSGATGAPVLIVEDDADVRRLLVHRFHRAGHRAIAVDSGEAALRAVAHERPHLAVVDVQLPGMSGLDFIRRLRADAPGEPVPVYVLSVVDPGDHEDVPPIEGYLVKPFTSGDISTMLRAIEKEGS